jgi:hypothetical protein
MSFFQIAPMTKVSTQIHSFMCQCDVFSSKKNEWKGSVRGVKVNFFFRGGYRVGSIVGILPAFK